MPQFIHEKRAALQGENALWRSVLGQAVRDIYGTDERARTETIRWIGTRDFEAVCMMADVEPDQMKNQMKALASLSRGLAMKYGSRLRDLVIAD